MAQCNGVSLSRIGEVEVGIEGVEEGRGKGRLGKGRWLRRVNAVESKYQFNSAWNDPLNRKTAMTPVFAWYRTYFSRCWHLRPLAWQRRVHGCPPEGAPYDV